VVLPGLAAALVVLAGPTAAQTDGTWTNTASGGLWGGVGNWNADTVADGSGATAFFNTLDITADNTIHLDSARTIGNLTFSDTATNTAAGWTIDNNGNAANILTLASGGTPTITVSALGGGKTATIAAEIAGTGGLAKTGNGALSLTASNSYSGATSIGGGGLLIISDASALGATGNGTTVSGGNQLRIVGGITVDPEPLTIAGNGYNTSINEGRGAFRSHSGNNTWTGPITITGGSETWISTSGGTFTLSGGITGNNQILRLDQGTPIVTNSPINLGANGQFKVNSTAHLAVGSNTFSTLTVDWGGNLIIEADNAVPTNATLIIGALSASPSAGTGRVNLNGYDMTIARLMDGGTNYAGEVITNSSATAATLALNQSANSTYRGAIGGTLGLVKDGAGALALAGPSTYSGTTVISNGTLAVNGTHLGGGAYTVAGGTLGGTGLIDAAVSVLAAGIVAPGNSIGTLTISNSFDLDGILQIELANAAGPGAGLGDLLDVNGFFDITNGTVQFVYSGTLTNDFYVFAEYDSLSGDPFFAIQNLPDGYGIDYAFGGNQIALVIPEPSTIALLALGYALVAGIARRRRR
jgi:autotransporter-associated beta strand protein